MAVAATPLAAQTLSKADEADARRVATQFYGDYVRYRDVRLLYKYYVVSFDKRSLRASDEAWCDLADPKLVRRLSNSELRRTYAALLNQFFVGTLYAQSYGNLVQTDDMEIVIRGLYPKKASDYLLHGDRATRLLMMGPHTEPTDSGLIEKRSDLRFFVQTNEAIFPALRRATRRSGTTARWIAYASDKNDPSITVEPCGAECNGLGQSSKITIDMPALRMQLVKQRASYKILWAYFPIDS